MEYNLKDSGTRSQFATGAQRDGQTGKGRMDLLPPDTMIFLDAYTEERLVTWGINGIFEVSKLFEKGALKYAARNWEKGIPLSRYFDSGLRHAHKAIRGDQDEDHATAAAWNAICGITTYNRAQSGFLPIELIDLPTPYDRSRLKSGDLFSISNFNELNHLARGITEMYVAMMYLDMENLSMAALHFLAAVELRERTQQKEKDEMASVVDHNVSGRGDIGATTPPKSATEFLQRLEREVPADKLKDLQPNKITFSEPVTD